MTKSFYSTSGICFGLVCLLSACATGGGGSATSMATSTAAVSSVLGGGGRPSDADLALSCAEIQSRLSNLYARYQEIEAAETAKRRKGAVTGAIADMGMAVLGGKMIGGISSVGGLRGMQTASAVSSIIAVENNGPNLQTVNDATAIATRTGQLERAKVEKGCG